jgi:hypothetical protein
MNANVITTIAGVIGLLVAMWTMLSNFDKRNGDRFDALQKQIEATKETLRAELKGEIGTLRAEFKGELVALRSEMHEMRAELRVEIREAADRRIVRQ